ncbi:MAG: hypothetical protein ACRD2X_08755 [Vicinamibacteraceae bacterium]
MIKLEWRFNGKRVAPGQLGNEMVRAFRRVAIDRAKAGVAKVRCPVHGSGPRNLTVRSTGSRLHLAYEACCDRLKQAVDETFR